MIVYNATIIRKLMRQGLIKLCVQVITKNSIGYYVPIEIYKRI